MNPRRILLLLGPILVAMVSLYFYATGGRHVSTDNAFVKADKVFVSAEVSGEIAEVNVSENQRVHKGDLLFGLDTASLQAAQARAEAGLAKAISDVTALQEAYRVKAAELGLAHTNLDYAEKEYRRQLELNASHFTSQTVTDERKHQLDIARQQITVIETDLQRLRASLNGDPDAPAEQHPACRQAAAELQQAQIAVGHASVHAPFDGVVSGLPKPGQHISTGTPALALVASTGMWIEANFNETELTYVQPGQPVDIHVDMYPEQPLHGKVASISQASGAEFSVLPAQNASGNWVKVVQRIPVRIELDQPPADLPLRAGMSVKVSVDTGHRRF